MICYLNTHRAPADAADVEIAISALRLPIATTMNIRLNFRYLKYVCGEPWSPLQTESRGRKRMQP